VTSHPQARRILALAVALLASFGVLFGATNVVAAPTAPLAAPDPDGAENKTLRDQLDAAARGYIEAKTAFDASKALEARLRENMQVNQLHLDLLVAQVSEVAAMSYRTGRLGAATALLESRSPDDFLSRAIGIEALTLYSDAQLNELKRLRRETAQQQDRLYAELATQTAQLAAMTKRKADAEKALAAAGGGKAAGGFVSGNSPAAKPAPRNADGSWPDERCTVDDPTTNGCLTPRTYHAYLETKNTGGFKHYVSCYRSGGSGEHPKGQACDWAAAVDGFRGIASGAERTYGDQLASWYVKNADRLGVMYVIWFRQIWLPGTGWKTYGSQDGTPSGDHTNHVHLSVY
jgi:hypothetical protein